MKNKNTGQIRLTKQNQYQASQAVDGTFVTVNKAVNQGFRLGLLQLRKKLGKKGAVAK